MKTLMNMIVVMLMVSASAMAEGGKGGGRSHKDPTSAPGVDKRVDKQKNRISRKLSKGKITQAEADKLNANVDAVKAKESELAADGKLSKEDRQTLHKDLKENNMQIKDAGKKAPATPAEN